MTSCRTLLALALLSFTGAARADVVLVQDGLPRARIYASAEVMGAADQNAYALKMPAAENERQRQRLRESVKDLAHYLEKMSGAKIEISTGAPAAGDATLPILIGDVAEKAFGSVGREAPYRQAFRVVVTPAGVGLWGESSLATSYSIYEILDRLGCRWYMPSEMGEVIPQRTTIALAEEDSTHAPGTIYRGILVPDEAYQRRNRCGGLLLSAGHALEMYITDKEREEHPQWKAEIGGQPHYHRLKWSNPQLAAALADKIIATYEDNPYPSYSLSPNDGADFDESAEDRALDAGDFDSTCQMPALTDRLMVLTNRVAERVTAKYPDLLFGVLAYVQYTRPPVREKVHPNVVPQIAPITYSRAHPMTDDRVSGNKDLRNLVEGWGKAARMTSVYFYGFNLAETSAPNPMITKWGVDAPIVLANGCQFWQPETLNNFETSMHGLYLSLRLAWDPTRKPAEIIDELNQRFYGHAASQMAAYWDHIDHVWVDTPEYSGCGFGYLRRFTPQRMQEARRLMDAAWGACQTREERFRVGLADESLAQFERFIQLRRDLADGRWDKLSLEAAAWRARNVALAEQYQDQYCFSRAYWTDLTVSGLYFSSFYQVTYDDANRLARDFTLLTPPLRAWRYQPDADKSGQQQGWAAADFDDSGWNVTDPCLETWSSLGYHDWFKSLWYRSKVDVPQQPAGKKVFLWVGATDGSVQVFVNGRHVPWTDDKGQTQDAFNGYCQPARFDITAALIPGQNQISLLSTRTAFNELGTGGLLAPVVLFREK